MLTNDYKLYVDSIILLTRSLVIKSTQTIDALNRYLQDRNEFVDLNDPTSWKYYLNLSGEYHYSDTPMEILSLDTPGVTIPFDKDLKVNHPLTYSEYLTYGRFYNELVDKYPEQEELINGILKPIDINEAIDAKDYTILQYDSRYVGAGETSLINDLQEWIWSYEARWDNKAYNETDPLYGATIIGILYSHIPGKIINLRLASCKTPQAHEYHIWNYLSGYYNLGDFKDRIHHAQALWLYRNMEFLVNNAGLESTLDLLHEDFCKPYGLTLDRITLQKSNDTLLSTLKHEPIASITALNDDGVITDASNSIEIDDLLKRMRSEALLNSENEEAHVKLLKNRILQSEATAIPTGIMEANVTTAASALYVDSVDEHFAHWFYLSSVGLFPYKFTIEIPGRDAVVVSSSEAIAILLFCAMRYQSIPLNTIPVIQVKDIMRTPAGITDADLTGLVEKHFISQERIDDVKRDIVEPKQVLSVPEFKAHVDEVLKRKVLHRLFVTNEKGSTGRAELRRLTDMFYFNHECSFTSFSDYPAFFLNIQTDLNGLSGADYANLAESIVNHFVGLVREENGLASPYYEMVEIVKILSSYTVNIIPGVGSESFESIEWAFLYPCLEIEELIHDQVITHKTVVTNTEDHEIDILTDDEDDGLQLEVLQEQEVGAQMEVGIEIGNEQEIEKDRVLLTNIDLKIEEEITGESLGNKSVVPGQTHAWAGETNNASYYSAGAYLTNSANSSYVQGAAETTFFDSFSLFATLSQPVGAGPAPLTSNAYVGMCFVGQDLASRTAPLPPYYFRVKDTSEIEMPDGSGGTIAIPLTAGPKHVEIHRTIDTSGPEPVVNVEYIVDDNVVNQYTDELALPARLIVHGWDGLFIGGLYVVGSDATESSAGPYDAIIIPGVTHSWNTSDALVPANYMAGSVDIGASGSVYNWWRYGGRVDDPEAILYGDFELSFKVADDGIVSPTGVRAHVGLQTVPDRNKAKFHSYNFFNYSFVTGAVSAGREEYGLETGSPSNIQIASSFQPSDVFKMRRTGTVYEYIHNGNVVYSFDTGNRFSVTPPLMLNIVSGNGIKLTDMSIKTVSKDKLGITNEHWEPGNLFNNGENGALLDIALSNFQSLPGSANDLTFGSISVVEDASGNNNSWLQNNTSFRPNVNRKDGLYGYNKNMPHVDMNPIVSKNSDYTVWCVGEIQPGSGGLNDVQALVGGRLEYTVGSSQGQETRTNFNADFAHFIGLHESGSSPRHWAAGRINNTLSYVADWGTGVGFERQYNDGTTVPFFDNRVLIGFSIDHTNGTHTVHIPSHGIKEVFPLDLNLVANIRDLNIFHDPLQQNISTAERNRNAQVQQAGVIDRVLTDAEWDSLLLYAKRYLAIK